MPVYAVQIPVDTLILDSDLALTTNSEGIVVFASGSDSSRHSTRNCYIHQDALAVLRTTKAFQIIPGATYLFAEPNTLEQVAILVRDWFIRYLTQRRSE